MDHLIEQNLARFKRVQTRIKEICSQYNRDFSEIKLVLVTKTIPLETIDQTISRLIEEKLLQTEQVILGENKVQEAQKKFTSWQSGDQVPNANRFQRHFIGHLQTNKVHKILPLIDLLHSLDRWSLAEKIQQVAERQSLRPKVLLQINLSKEESKFGVFESEVIPLIKKLSSCPHLHLKGLMTMAAYRDPKVETVFSRLKQLKEEINQLKLPGIHLQELSMGMSGDFETAIKHGATLIRIGSAIFGERTR